MLLNIAFIFVMSILNRIRGGGLYIGELFDNENPNKLPGRSLYLVALLLAPLTYFISHDVIISFIIAVGFLIWGSAPWGHLFGLGRFSPDRPISKFEQILLKMAFGNVYLALFYRHLLVLPLLVAVSLYISSYWYIAYVPIFSALVVLSYEFGWRIYSKLPEKMKNPILIGELLTGMIWGGLIILLV